jgi:hypothetical protein
VTTHRRRKAQPATPQPTATPFTPRLELSEEDRRELWEPPAYIETPEYPDELLPGWSDRFNFVVTICASDWYKEHFPDARANLDDALRAGRDRHPEPQPEPDLEAEP